MLPQFEAEFASLFPNNKRRTETLFAPSSMDTDEGRKKTMRNGELPRINHGTRNGLYE